MKVSKYLHSCLLLEEKGERILIDPGSLSFMEGKVKPQDLKGLNAILITHKHYDHYDIPALKGILSVNPGIPVFTNDDMAGELQENGIEPTVFQVGALEVGSFKILAISAAHEHLPFPMPKNIGFLINEKLLHPGDSFDKRLLEFHSEYLALPVAAPWLNVNQALDFAEKYKPRTVLPIHDGFMKEVMLAGQYKMWQGLLSSKNIDFKNLLNPGDSIEI